MGVQGEEPMWLNYITNDVTVFNRLHRKIHSVKVIGDILLNELTLVSHGE